MKYRLDHIAVTTSDLRASQSFWETVFGATSLERPTTGVSQLGAWYKIGEIELHLQYREKPTFKTDQHFALEVADADSLAERCRSMGRMVEAPDPLPGFARRFFLYDPDDNRVEILQKA
ncbi:MAG: VOC family protein [Candidatus Zixiibacteriota bacterium]